jgi:hypothetical protein
MDKCREEFDRYRPQRGDGRLECEFANSVARDDQGDLWYEAYTFAAGWNAKPAPVAIPETKETK